MTKKINKAEEVRKIIRAHIALVHNNQDDLIVEAIKKKGLYKTNHESRRSYMQQKDKVLQQHQNEIKAIAMAPTMNKDGHERKTVTERLGKQTLTSKIKNIISVTLESGLDLGDACEQIEKIIVLRYKEKGTYEDHKPSYYRLISRNEIERLAPKVQANLGLEIQTPTEIKMATRKRKWERKTLASV